VHGRGRAVWAAGAALVFVVNVLDDPRGSGRVATQPFEGTDELHRLAAAAMMSTTVASGSAVESITR
jgi:hypothetical protein